MMGPAMELLPNPEREWERPQRTISIDRAEVERRIGSTTEPLEVLSGGLANLNVRIGRDRVLRIHRGEPGRVAKEAALLRARGARLEHLSSAGQRGSRLVVLPRCD
jgi:hypothetical protein